MVEMAAEPWIHGFTTNPSLMRKAGVTDYSKYCQEISFALQGKPVSFEVFADDLASMKQQALKIHAWEKPASSPIYVKIPVTNSKGVSCAPLIQELSHQNIKLNVTAVYTLQQTAEVAAALQGGAPSILSIFAGRIADSGVDPLPLMREALSICEKADSSIELLWASCREPFNIAQAREMGCAIITAPLDMLKKSRAFGKDLKQLSLETVQTFKSDAEAAHFSL